MTTEAHVVVVVLTLLALAFILRLVRTRRLKAKYSLLWLTLGGAMVVASIIPGMLDRSARSIGVRYEPALYFAVGLLFVLLVVVHFSYELSRLENRVRTLAEEVTLLRHELDLRDPPASAPTDASTDAPTNVAADVPLAPEGGPTT